MPEAEDVILDAAERVTAAARHLWRRHRPALAESGILLDDVRRRLSVLLTAAFDADWPICAAEPAPARGWLARRFGSGAPWDTPPCAEPYTDGARIFLPQCLHVSDDDADGELLRVMGLVLGARLARRAIACCPHEPITRDLFWAREGVLAERAVVEQLPGLGGALARARAWALRQRPDARSLTAVERRVEGIVQRLLRHGPDQTPSPPAASLAWARAAAAAFDARHYRGLTPVLHWGRARPELVANELAVRPLAEATGAGADARPTRSRRLARQPRPRRDHQPASDRPGPFVIPFGDPQQSVQDAAGLQRVHDTGEDVDLDALVDELARLEELARVRSDDPVREILSGDADEPRGASGAAAALTAQPGALLYPEWDHRSAAYRAAYCRLREAPAAAGDPTWLQRALDEHRALLGQVRRRFAALRPRRRRQLRQLDGDDLDLDAYVEDFADRRAGRSPGERLYTAERRAAREVAVALLIDASGSTDAWVSGGRRVLDVEKEAGLVFSEALQCLRDRFAMFAFSGARARHVDVWRVKGFDEAYGAAVQARLAGLAGEAFTRLGAPLRHVTAALAAQPSRARLLLLLSDGKPNDEDEYEGRYGSEDTRQAVAEARLQGVQVFCLAVRREPGADLARLFGPAGYTLVADVRELPARLPEIYRRLTRLLG